MISTVSCPRLVWRRSKGSRVLWRESSPSSTGTASAPSLVWIKKPTKASAATSALLSPCAGEFATCALAEVKVASATQAEPGKKSTRGFEQKLKRFSQSKIVGLQFHTPVIFALVFQPLSDLKALLCTINEESFRRGFVLPPQSYFPSCPQIRQSFHRLLLPSPRSEPHAPSTASVSCVACVSKFCPTLPSTSACLWLRPPRSSPPGGAYRTTTAS